MLQILKSAGTTTDNVFEAINQTSYLAVDTVKVARTIVNRCDGLVNRAFDALEKELDSTESKAEPKAKPKAKSK